MILPLQTEACGAGGSWRLETAEQRLRNWRAESVDAKEMTDGEVEVK